MKMTLAQRIFYPPLRLFFYFFFTYMPYWPVKRFNKPKKLTGPILYCSSHSNFMCDVTLAGWELPLPPRFLAKATLFRFPIKSFLEFCGTLPLIRPQDREKMGGDPSEQNKKSFSAASGALKSGWPICILPEGTSAEAPGIVLPLKAGVARLALAAEASYDWKLGLRIFPVSLEYNEKTKSFRGMNVRYGREINVADYADVYRQEEEQAVRKLMADITDELVINYPHFETNELESLGKSLVELGIFANTVAAARAIKRWDKEELDKKVKLAQDLVHKMEEARLPYSAFHSLEKLQAFPIWAQILAHFYVLVLWPIALWSIVNQALNRLLCRALAWKLGSDSTEFMTFRVGAGVLLTLPLYFGQWLAWKQLPFFGQLSFWAYASFALMSWVVEKFWFYFWNWIGTAAKARQSQQLKITTDYLRIRTEISG